ncbi:MAG: Stp1/IreP family PP2C-type Ser/Thr phosphatase [Oscillospiraceae bacterium]|jgi:protein phosphatase|nr:Stp1/IreP family PP2C-type Ser/Thr phosphatase [Oscillospiraceae bacterium]
MKYFGLTDKGIVRLNNQDCFLTTEVRDRLVAVLCDGMGGHAAGELASKVASETFLAEVSAGLGSRTNRKPNIPALLKNACRSANHEVCEHALLSPAFEGMGSTLVGLCTDKNGKAYIANVGDSRCYLLSRFTKRIRQITVDHSLVEEYVRAGIITPEEARNHPKKNIITRAIGTGDPEPEADIFKLHIQRGQALLLCSDGLSNSVPDKEILNSYLQIPNDPETLCRRLLDFAFQGGARDNVTMLVVVRV